MFFSFPPSPLPYSLPFPRIIISPPRRELQYCVFGVKGRCCKVVLICGCCEKAEDQWPPSVCSKEPPRSSQQGPRAGLFRDGASY